MAAIATAAIPAAISLMGMLFGREKQHKEKLRSIPTMDPNQQALFSQLLGGLGGQGGALSSGMGNLSQLLSGSPQAFQAYEAPAMRQFQQEIIPGIAERFSRFGQGSQQSSAFGQQMGQAGSMLSENLAAQRGGLQQNAMSQLISLLGLGTQTPTQQSFYTPSYKSPGAFGSFASGMAPYAGQSLGNLPSLLQQQSQFKDLLDYLQKGRQQSPQTGQQF